MNASALRPIEKSIRAHDTEAAGIDRALEGGKVELHLSPLVHLCARELDLVAIAHRTSIPSTDLSRAWQRHHCVQVVQVVHHLDRISFAREDGYTARRTDVERGTGGWGKEGAVCRQVSGKQDGS